MRRPLRRLAEHRGRSRAAMQAARFAAVVQSSNDAIFAKTLAGRILEWNPAAERIYGWSAPEVLGRSEAVLIPPEGAPELADIMRRIRAGEQVDPFETVRLHRDGRRIEVAVTV